MAPQYNRSKDSVYTRADGERGFRARTSAYTHDYGLVPSRNPPAQNPDAQNAEAQDELGAQNAGPRAQPAAENIIAQHVAAARRKLDGGYMLDQALADVPEELFDAVRDALRRALEEDRNEGRDYEHHMNRGDGV